MRIIHLVSGLGVGGAELTLTRVLPRLGPRFQSVVVSLGGTGEVAPRLADQGIEVVLAGVGRSIAGVLRSLALPRLIRELQPSLIHGWLYHGSFAAQLGAGLGGVSSPVIWNIRHSAHDLRAERISTHLLIRAMAALSKWPARVIYNSPRCARQHERMGYSLSRSTVVLNGFDCEEFRPDPMARSLLRQEIGIPPGTPLIGLVARRHPVKDHATFLQAAVHALRAGCKAQFLLVGRGTIELRDSVGRLGLSGSVHCLGARNDIPRITAALDIATCCSRAEAFPNVVGEAMACAVPCVVTDVGECPNLVGNTGVVVRPRNSTALADAWIQLLGLPATKRTALGLAGRDRILRDYSIDRVVAAYQNVYDEVLHTPAPTPCVCHQPELASCQGGEDRH